MIARASAVGAAIGLSAGIYQLSRRDTATPGSSSGEGQFMTDAATLRQVSARQKQAAVLDELLRGWAPAIEECRQRAEVGCGLRQRSACLAAKAAAAQEYEALREALVVEAAKVSYGSNVSPEDRNVYVATYGCIAWTDDALSAIAARGPIVEVGAGQGQWARALKTRGVDIVAYDDGSALPASGDVPVAAVTLGIDGSKAAGQHPERSLLLVAPPPGRQPLAWLVAYAERGGRRLLYAGEGRGGAHADETFFAALERGWRLVDTATLRPFPGGAERLWVLERR